MNAAQHNQFASFIWSIANILRDYYARGRYRDIILPMVVVRRLDALLEPTKTDVLKRVPDGVMHTEEYEASAFSGSS